VEDLDDLVWQQVIDLLEKPKLIHAELERRRQESLRSDPLEQRRGELTQSLKRTEQQIDRLLDAYQEGLVQLGQLRQRMPELRRKQATAEKELENARWKALIAEKTHQIEQSLEAFVGRLRQSAQNLSMAERQKVVRLLIKDIVVGVDNQITIRHCLPLMGGVRKASGAEVNCYPLCKGRHHRPLRGTLLGRLPAFEFFEHSGLQALLQQRQDLAVHHALLHQLHQPFLRYRVEVALEIQVPTPGAAFSQQLFHPFYRLPTAPSGSKPVAVLGKVVLEDRFQHVFQGPFHRPVAHRRYAQRTLLLRARFGYPNPPRRLPAVAFAAQFFAQSGQLGLFLRLKLRYGLAIYPRAALLAPDRPKGRLQIALREHLIP
jgi:site-specific DNA recombinase